MWTLEQGKSQWRAETSGRPGPTHEKRFYWMPNTYKDAVDARIHRYVCLHSLPLCTQLLSNNNQSTFQSVDQFGCNGSPTFHLLPYILTDCCPSISSGYPSTCSLVDIYLVHLFMLSFQFVRSRPIPHQSPYDILPLVALFILFISSCYPSTCSVVDLYLINLFVLSFHF